MVGHDWGKEEEEEVEWVFQMVLYQWFSTSGMTIDHPQTEEKVVREQKRTTPIASLTTLP